jgi:metal transporter CNNM
MGLDVSGLEIIIKGSQDPNEIENAQRIMPLRSKGNLLLCTLLLGNTAVNTFLTVVAAELTSGAMGAAISTGLIVIFGEIFPQAACSRFALTIGAKSVPLVWLFMILLCPIAYPISKVLDHLLGDEMALTYDTKELKQLITNQMDDPESNVMNMQGQIMLGALDVNNKVAKELMTPWHSVYAMSTSETMNSDTVMELYEYGYTRIPV